MPSILSLVSFYRSYLTFPLQNMSKTISSFYAISKKDCSSNIWHYFIFMLAYLKQTGNLKILGLYLYTHIIGYKSCNMFGILNKLTLQKELPNFVTKKVFLDKK